MPTERFTTVRISKELHTRIKALIREGKLEGNHTVSGFINHAVEERLLYIMYIRSIDSPQPKGNDDDEADS
jgi:hypothetical protein